MHLHHPSSVLAELLPPPPGLNLGEIRTEKGLLAAIEREAANLEGMKALGRHLDRERIRLICFLAGEVRRRIENLTPEQRMEFQRIREEAHLRGMELEVRKISAAVEEFILAIDRQGAAIRFTHVTELEYRVQALANDLGADPAKFAAFLERLAGLARKLEWVKGRGASYGGLPDFG